MWIIDDNTGRVTIDPDAIDEHNASILAGSSDTLSREMRAAVAWMGVEAIPNQSWTTIADDEGKRTTVVVDPDAAIVHIMGPGIESGDFCFYTIDRSTTGNIGQLRASLCIGAADGGYIVEWRLAALALALLVPSVDPVLASNVKRILSDPRILVDLEHAAGTQGQDLDMIIYDNALNE